MLNVKLMEGIKIKILTSKLLVQMTLWFI